MADVFSVVAMFILFREALEAAIIISIMLQMCERLKLQKSKRQVWLGVGVGLGVTLVIGTAFVVVFYVARTRIFSGIGQMIFKGYINLFAAYLIAVLAFAMLRFMNYEKKWERKLLLAASRVDENKSSKWTIFLLAFAAIFREGLETVIFLAGVSTSVPITSIPSPALWGLFWVSLAAWPSISWGNRFATLPGSLWRPASSSSSLLQGWCRRGCRRGRP
eukprot:jgi/Botrbrau1/16853/Bobra.150_2s0075.1